MGITRITTIHRILPPTPMSWRRTLDGDEQPDEDPYRELQEQGRPELERAAFAGA